MFNRKCPKCDKIISYANRSNLRRAEKTNKVCKSCAQEELKSNPNYCERNLKISEKRVKYFLEIDDVEHIRQIEKMRNSLKETYNKKSDIWKENWKNLCSKISKERWSDEDYKKRVRETMSINNWSRREDSQEIIDKAIVTKLRKYGKSYQVGRCKEYKIGNLVCYGKSELKFINHLISEASELPSNFLNYLETPFGKYHPDFEFDGYFIEVKSDFTFDVLLGKKSYSKTKYSNPLQLKKILWVSENVKPVKVIVVTGNSISEYDFNYLRNFSR